MRKLLVVILLVSIGFGIVACSEEKGTSGNASEEDYAKKGVLVEGIIKTKYKKKFKTQEGTKRDYYIQYTFEANGKKYESNYKVPEEVYAQVQDGEPIEVQYIKDEPKKNRLTLSLF